MVQYRPPGNNSPSERDYWRLKSYEELSCKDSRRSLGHGPFRSGPKDQNPCGPKFSNDKGRLVYLCSRMDRGLLNYEKCSSGELKQFCDRRQITLRPAWQHKMSYMYLLENLDARGVFDGILRLPSELRLQIYERYFDWIRSVIYAYELLVPPPLAQVCRVWRNEVLPLFYSSFRYRMTISNRISHHDTRAGTATWTLFRKPDFKPLVKCSHLLQFVTRIRLQAYYLIKDENGYFKNQFDAWEFDFRPFYGPKATRKVGRREIMSASEAKAWDEIGEEIQAYFSRALLRDDKSFQSLDDKAVFWIYARAWKHTTAHHALSARFYPEYSRKPQ
ncbi:hypothetical protein HII31_12619 [Pseudocercospora fuligena]|uniref:F-box domain-containing protein n=1 Tax=Pseudocercospora fuligena TaxID=685502 RepID=A0A8H6R936_9PEZI|nr:hypothetical protein HII31_12619 [Pseudocercospora fuligena]